MKKVGIAIIIVILLGSGYFLIDQLTSQPQGKISKEPVQDEKGPETELEDAAITLYSEDDSTKWRLSAQSISRFKEPKRIELNQIRATVYQAEKEVISLIAEKGDFDPRTGFLSLHGSLTIQSQQKIVKADHLKWNQAQNQLTGRGNVVIKQPGLKITGDSFISQVDLKKLQVLGNAKAVSNES
ncbi:hypothetical protein JCM16358_13180 [Halanaerocella petrolearia]